MIDSFLADALTHFGLEGRLGPADALLGVGVVLWALPRLFWRFVAWACGDHLPVDATVQLLVDMLGDDNYGWVPIKDYPCHALHRAGPPNVTVVLPRNGEYSHLTFRASIDSVDLAPRCNRRERSLLKDAIRRRLAIVHAARAAAERTEAQAKLEVAAVLLRAGREERPS